MEDFAAIRRLTESSRNKWANVQAARDRTRKKRPLDLGCIPAHGTFAWDPSGCFTITNQGKLATSFLLELIARLQSCGIVPMIDTRAYAKWLAN